MKEEIKITITITDETIALHCKNVQALFEDDITDIIEMLSNLAKNSSSLQGRRPNKWKCVNSSSRFTPTVR